MATFDTPGPITLTLEIASGAIRVVATDRPDTTVDVRPRDPSRSHDVTAADAVHVDLRGGALTVTSRRGFAIPRRGAVAVDVELPSGSRLHTSVASAHVRADGAYGDVTFDSASGDLVLGGVAGSVVANTASGDIRIDDVDGDVGFRAAGGDLRVGHLRGTLKAQTASGDITVATAVRGDIAVQTSSGDVAVGIAEGTAAHLELRTGKGAIHNHLTQCDGPADGDETLSVTVTAGSSDITVARSTATPAAVIQP